jgi:hypothetical protein
MGIIFDITITIVAAINMTLATATPVVAAATVLVLGVDGLTSDPANSSVDHDAV